MAFSSAGLLNEPSPPAVDQVALVADPPIVPASVAVVPAQMTSGAPASTEAGVNRVMVTSLKVPAHMPPVSVMVQRNTLSPKASPPTDDVGELGLLKDPEPEISVHVPISPTPGLLAASTVLSAQTFWSGPASAWVITGTTASVPITQPFASVMSTW